MEGVYRARASSWGLGESKSGKEQLAIEFRLTDPEAPTKLITAFLFFTEKTFDRTIESLRHCGWQGDDLTNLSGLDANEVDLVLEEEEYEGKRQTKVKWINRCGGLTLKAPLSEDKARTFAASMRDRIRALDASAGRPAAKPAAKATVTNFQKPATKGDPRPEPPPITDDIPF